MYRSCFLLIMVLLLYQGGWAQLCQGSLGDPIVNISFGAGNNPGPAQAAATTAYQYVSTDCPADGYYTVRNSTSGCFGNTWHTLSDHTGNQGGYFMLVNASFQPGTFYLDTIRGLCNNTTYELASWIANVLVPSSCGGNTIRPNITFTVEKTDGTILQQYNTADISPAATPVWKQYGFFFATPTAITDVVVRLVNNAQGGCGNDLALDDITFRACGPTIQSTINNVAASPVNFCEGTVRNFNLNCSLSGGFSNPAYQWQQRDPATPVWTDIPGANSLGLNEIFPASVPAGLYEYRLAVAEAGNLASPRCRVYSSTFSFTLDPLPISVVTGNAPVCETRMIMLTASGGATYAWSGPAGFTASGSLVSIASANVGQSGMYYVNVSSARGCVKKDSVNLLVQPSPRAFVSLDSVQVCKGIPVQLLAGGGIAYRWSPAAGLSDPNIANPVATPLFTTLYSVSVSNQFGCTDTALTRVIVNNKPVVNAGPDRVSLGGQPVQLIGSVLGSVNFSWSPQGGLDDVNVLQPLANPVSDTSYVLTAVSPAGCGTSSDTVFVKVFKALYIPNAFSPNGDNINDTWNIPALAAITGSTVVVYNRWGQKVFVANDNAGWDGVYKGSPVPAGAYHYTIFIPGGVMLKGSLLLLR